MSPSAAARCLIAFPNWFAEIFAAGAKSLRDGFRERGGLVFVGRSKMVYGMS